MRRSCKIIEGKMYATAFGLGLDELDKVDRLHRKQLTIVDLPRLTIKEIEEEFLQGFAVSRRLGRERATGEF